MLLINGPPRSAHLFLSLHSHGGTVDQPPVARSPLKFLHAE